MIKSRFTKAGDIVIILICFVIISACLLPMLNILAQSLSSPLAIVNREVFFGPVTYKTDDNGDLVTDENGNYIKSIVPILDSYRYVFRDPSFSRSLVWTAILTVICTLTSLGITILCAYPLTYNILKGRKFINTVIIFTMYFSAGTIPNYILMKDLLLINNPLVLILPNCLSVFNMIILRSFFYGVPDSLRESAELDGANPFTVLLRIYLPLSAPVLATLALFYAVGRWNGFSDALLYLTKTEFHPIQLKLYNVINNLSSIEIATQEGIAGGVPQATDGMKAASVMIATIPILVVYPWLQRYFIAGVSLGAVKG